MNYKILDVLIVLCILLIAGGSYYYNQTSGNYSMITGNIALTEIDLENPNYADPNYPVNGIFTISDEVFDMNEVDSVDFEVVVDRKDGFVYKKGYYYDYGENNWSEFLFEEATVGNSNWIADGADASISIDPEGKLKNGYNLVVTYSCEKIEGEWICGCVNADDTQCDKWMLHLFDVQNINMPAVVIEDPLDSPLGSPGNPYLIGDINDLQAMNDNLTASYILTSDMDASETIGWNSGNGFEGIGSFAEPFEGTLDGDGKVITGLFISGSLRKVGLIDVLGSRGVVRDIGLEGVDVSGSSIVGSLVGENKGLVEGSYSSGTAFTKFGVTGGLVGNNMGVIRNSYSFVDVTGNIARGGLVGTNNGVVENSYASGSISSQSNILGGLVGRNNADIEDSFSVISIDYTKADSGGLVGDQLGSISNSGWYNDLSGGECYGGGNEGCLEVLDVGYFQDSTTNAPLDVWNFNTIWQENVGGYPTLRVFN